MVEDCVGEGFVFCIVDLSFGSVGQKKKRSPHLSRIKEWLLSDHTVNRVDHHLVPNSLVGTFVFSGSVVPRDRELRCQLQFASAAFDWIMTYLMYVCVG